MTAPPNNLNWSFRLITMIFYQKLSSNASVILKKLDIKKMAVFQAILLYSIGIVNCLQSQGFYI